MLSRVALPFFPLSFPGSIKGRKCSPGAPPSHRFLREDVLVAKVSPGPRLWASATEGYKYGSWMDRSGKLRQGTWGQGGVSSAASVPVAWAVFTTHPGSTYVPYPQTEWQLSSTLNETSGWGGVLCSGQRASTLWSGKLGFASFTGFVTVDVPKQSELGFPPGKWE